MSCYIRLRGLPWSVTHQEILDFLKGVNVVNGTKGIHMVLSRWDGKNTGEAFVELASSEDETEAFKLNKETLGHRYIEIFSATNEEAQSAMKNPNFLSSNVVKLRGLPYAITEQMIEEFFNGINLKQCREGIVIVMDRRGRATGEAYVQFETSEDTEQALLRNREKIGHRYIEIFRSSLGELRRHTNNRPGPYNIKDRGSMMRNRDDFGGNNSNNIFRENNSGFGNNNKGGFGGGNNKPMGMNGPGNGLNLGGFGLFSGLSGFNNDNNGGGGGGSGGGGNNNFNRTLNNMMGGSNNSSLGCNKNFNPGVFWNNDMNKNRGGPNGGGGGDNGQGFDGGNLFNNDNDNGKFNSLFDRGNNRMNMGIGSLVNKIYSDMGLNNFGNNMDFRNDNDIYCIHMRGLPYNAFENEVYKFFEPIRPINVKIIYNNKGLHSGSADAMFYSYEDSKQAMKKHMEQIGTRYIELFFDGKTKGNNKSGGGGGGGGGGFMRQHNKTF